MDAIESSLQILGVRAEATPDEINQAYRDLAMVWHPDRFSNGSRLRQKAEDTLKRINEAYRILRYCDRTSNAHSRPSRDHSHDSRQPNDCNADQARKKESAEEGSRTQDWQVPRLVANGLARFIAGIGLLALIAYFAGVFVGLVADIGVAASGNNRPDVVETAVLNAIVRTIILSLTAFGISLLWRKCAKV
jgi:hypothetical protein